MAEGPPRQMLLVLQLRAPHSFLTTLPLLHAAAAADDAASLEAFKSATGMKDESLSVALAASLPRAVQEDQIRLRNASLESAAAEEIRCRHS